ncbi:MAG: peptidase M22 [Lacunisphaera sp.]|nr:peptidase M22 [Lacunisphaera sp.]
MPLLTQLLASHGRLLVLDAASTRVQVGLLRSDAPALWRNREAEAGAALFKDTQAVLDEAGVKLDDVGAFIFCEGPGSMLGTRTVAMTIRTWQVLRPRPTYAYQSLTLLAHNIRFTGTVGPFAVITDARRNTWNTVAVTSDGTVQPLQRLPVAELAARPERLYSPPVFRAWAPPPRPTRDYPYTVAALLDAHAELDLFSAAPAPDAFQHTAPEYKKWSAQVHSAATATPR